LYHIISYLTVLNQICMALIATFLNGKRVFIWQISVFKRNANLLRREALNYLANLKEA